MLVQLPNGDWVKPEEVNGVIVQRAGWDKRQFHSAIVQTDSGDYVCDHVTFEGAVNLRDQISEQINAALYQEGKRL